MERRSLRVATSVAPESELIGAVGIVVGVAPGNLAKRSIALYTDEVLESRRKLPGRDATLWRRTCKRLAVNLEESLVGVFQLPDEHHSYHDRITGLVIDLDRFRIKVAGTEADALLAHERIDPVETGAGERTTVFSEEYECLSLIRLQLDETVAAEAGDEQQDTAHSRKPRSLLRQGKQVD